MENMFTLSITLALSEEWLFVSLVSRSFGWPEFNGSGLHGVLQLFTVVDVAADKHAVVL